jgi:hypothetical protein
MTGVYRKTDDDKTSSTDAFYKCFDDALEKFIAQNDITILVKGSSQSVMLNKNDL